MYLTEQSSRITLAERDRPAITPAMIEAGVAALARLCPVDVAFPAGGERDAVEAVLKAALQAGQG